MQNMFLKQWERQEERRERATVLRNKIESMVQHLEQKVWAGKGVVEDLGSGDEVEDLVLGGASQASASQPVDEGHEASKEDQMSWRKVRVSDDDVVSDNVRKVRVSDDVVSDNVRLWKRIVVKDEESWADDDTEGKG